MSLYRRAGSDRWVSEITINGQRYRRSTGTADKRAARAIEAQWRIDILTGRAAALSAPKAPQIRMLTVEEAMRRYYTEELEPRQQKPRTERSARYNLALIPAYFGADRPLDQITTTGVSEWRTTMLEQKLAPASVNRRMSDLRAILRKAQRWGVLKEVPRFDACKLPAHRDRYLSDEEFERIRRECPPHLQTLVTFLAGIFKGAPV